MKNISGMMFAVVMTLFPLVSHADNFVQNDYSATSTPSEMRVIVRNALQMSKIDDISVVMAVVECESHFRQYDASGDVLASPTDDYGVMQINAHYWYEKAVSMGYDIFSIDGNINMGIFILKTSGIKAWSCLKLVATM